MNKSFLPVMVLILSIGCVGRGNYIESNDNHYGSMIESDVKIKGKIEKIGNIYNIRKKKYCIGILYNMKDYEFLSDRAGKIIELSGRLKKRNCGRDFVCDESLCSPIMLELKVN